MFTRLVCSRGLWGESIPCLFTSFWAQEATLGAPPASVFARQSPPVSLCCLLFCLMRILILGFRTHSSLGRSPFEILTLIKSARTLLTNKVTFWGSGYLLYLVSWVLVFCILVFWVLMYLLYLVFWVLVFCILGSDVSFGGHDSTHYMCLLWWGKSKPILGESLTLKGQISSYLKKPLFSFFLLAAPCAAGS